MTTSLLRPALIALTLLAAAPALALDLPILTFPDAPVTAPTGTATTTSTQNDR